MRLSTCCFFGVPARRSCADVIAGYTTQTKAAASGSSTVFLIDPFLLRPSESLVKR